MRNSWMMIAVLGFSLSALISCSSDDVASDLKDVEPETVVPNAVVATDNSANSVETQETVAGASEHWILSVPFRKIEIGNFVMGSPLDENLRDDEDQQQVKITKPFEIGFRLVRTL